MAKYLRHPGWTILLNLALLQGLGQVHWLGKFDGAGFDSFARPVKLPASATVQSHSAPRKAKEMKLPEDLLVEAEAGRGMVQCDLDGE